MTGPTIHRDGYDSTTWRRAQPNSPERIALRERFARNHPEVASGECYAEGRRARANGKSISTCPWLRFSEEEAEWRRGWNGQPSQFVVENREAA